MSDSIPALPPRKGPGGIDAYCHVCWVDVYGLWVDKELPDYDRCPLGPYTAQTCPNSLAHGKNLATFAELKRQGLWPTKDRQSAGPTSRKEGEG